MQIIYLHGFASSPLSRKSVALKKRLGHLDHPFLVPDLNIPDFEHQRASRAIEHVLSLVTETPSLLVGSSLGGLIGLHVAARGDRVRGLVLLAPALDMEARWRAWLGDGGIEAWKRDGSRPFFNFATGTLRPLDFGFLEDIAPLSVPPPPRVPTWVVHGLRDESVPIASSRALAKAHPDLVRLREVQDDHNLYGSLDPIVVEVEAALGAVS